MLTIPVPFGFVRASPTTNGSANLPGGSAKNTNTGMVSKKRTRLSRIFGGLRKIHPQPSPTLESPPSDLPCPTNTNAEIQLKHIVVTTKSPNSKPEIS